jgi:predicted DNA-binding transcriptional regulator YafY
MAAGPGRDPVKAMERLARIIAVLDNAGRVGATTEELLAVAQYGGTAAPQDQLGVDIRNLRKQGWQIDNLAGKGKLGRYRMVSGDNRLRVKLSPEQLAALQRAVILSERSDLAKRLGVKPGSIPEGVGSEVLPNEESAELSLALQSVQLGSRIRFSYKGSPRVVHPGSVRFQNYQWYLSGREEGLDFVKHFAVARMSDVSLDKPGSAEDVPEVRRIPLHPLRWEIDPPTPVTVRTSPEYVPDVVRWLMAPDAQTEHDGVVDMRYTVTNREAFRARIYVLGERVRIADGGDVHVGLVAELRSMVGL